MKIRNVILAVLFSVAFWQGASAQMELRLDLGYGFPIAGQGNQTLSGNNYTATQASLGAGFNVALAGQYMFGDHLGAGLDLNMLFATPVVSTYETGGITATRTMTGSLFAITPYLVLSAHNEGINPYSRFGLVIGVASITETTTESGTGAPAGTNTYVYSGGLGLGLYSAFGLQFPLSDMMNLNVEIFDRTLSYAPEKQVNTTTYDGATKENDVTFVDSIDKSNTSNDKQLKSWIPFSSWGLKVGISLKLGGK